MNRLEQVVNKITTEGWSSLFTVFIRKAKLLRDDYYRNLILRNKFVASLFPFKQPSILIVSYPRSGSSWVGAILAKSKNLAYMFEPVTRPYQKYQAGYAMADLRDQTIYHKYLAYSREAFIGMPPKHLDSSENIRDFSLFGRKQKQLLIKEVNPRATRLYCEEFNPKILLLLRHPAAVALSFLQRGWLESPDVQLDTDDLEGTAWEKFGFSYGQAMREALNVIKFLATEYKIIFYEELADDPQTGFSKIFEYLDVELPNNYDKVIDEFCFSGTATLGYQTRRVSKKMITKWKDELTPEIVSQIKKGYLLSGLNFYQSHSDW